MPRYRALEVPEGIDEAINPVELVRFWIGGSEDYVSLNIGVFEKGNEAFAWGMVAADIVKHAVRGMMQSDPSRSETGLYAEIERGFKARLGEAAKISGQLKGEVH